MSRLARPLVLLLIIALLFAHLPRPIPHSAAQTGDDSYPLGPHAPENLSAFTRLLGAVRFFHPSDEVAGMSVADWEVFTRQHLGYIERARDDETLVARLQEICAATHRKAVRTRPSCPI